MRWLSEHPQIVMNARIARKFKLDPAVLLDDGGDEFVAMVRQAALLVVQRDEKREADDMKSRRRR